MEISQQAPTCTPNRGHILIRLLPWGSGALLVAGYAFLIGNLNRTLDLSDEGAYLLQISRPFDDAYKIGITAPCCTQSLLSWARMCMLCACLAWSPWV